MWLAAAVACVVVIMLLRRFVSAIVKFALRGGIGVVMIMLLNSVIGVVGVGAVIGINVVTILTTALLGIPGLALLYAAALALA
jgi:inhibitor of the pro-sigma K processing machinery